MDASLICVRSVSRAPVVFADAQLTADSGTKHITPRRGDRRVPKLVTVRTALDAGADEKRKAPRGDSDLEPYRQLGLRARIGKAWPLP
jgi:hypothetical protein